MRNTRPRDFKNADKIINTISNDKIMQERWVKYQNEFNYAQDISFEDTVGSIIKMLEGTRKSEKQ